MAPLTLAEVPNLGRPAAKCRKRAGLCRTRAANSFYASDEEAWLQFATQWMELAEAFELEDRFALN